MGIFQRIRGKSINEYVALSQETNAVLIDVRHPDEFEGGHIPGAINVPLGEIGASDIQSICGGRPLYLYCKSGMRSARACKLLKAAGIDAVVNIGGITSYNGKLDR